ncbi:MAG: RNA-directed DNA polymerase [Phycisphaeraceae bacterium]|nr:RNA-directed DNA polymerase [Phycisphaeraceae bacterium]MCW5764067.1 RNA-directed DNA polymerase [Phycisphaeraceae bacterium]
MRQEPPTIRRPLEPRVVTIQQLAALVNLPVNQLDRFVLEAPKLYSSFEVPKPNGKTRTIRPPARPLRDLQRMLLEVLQECVRYPRWLMGGVPKRSIFDHAKPHVGWKMVATFDVKAFFPSTRSAMIRPVLERIGISDAAADAVLRLVIKDDELPQGSPTSGFLANLTLEPADRRIDALCRRHGLNFTRYVDDMAISGNTDLTKFQGAIVEAVKESGYEVAPEKIHYMDRSKTQLITKLRVNDKIRPTREFIAEVKADIWECLNVGAAVVAIERGVQLHRLKSSLTGKVSHIRSADREAGEKLKGMLYGVDWNQQLHTKFDVPSLTA